MSDAIQTIRSDDEDFVRAVAAQVFSHYDGSGRDWMPDEQTQIRPMHMADRAGVLSVTSRGREVCVKLFYDNGLKARLRRLFRCGKGRQAWRSGVELMNRQVIVPAMIGYAEDERGLGLLITELIEDYQQVQEYLSPEIDVPAFLDSLGRFVRDVHDAGVAHEDLSPRNILTRPDGPGWRFILLDYEDCTFYPSVPEKIRQENLHHMADRFVRSIEGIDPQPFYLGYEKRR